MNISKESLLK